MSTALLTGLSGQDGSFLAELLLEKGYDVAAVVHGEPDGPLGCAEHLRDRVRLLAGDLLDPASLASAVQSTRPHELYHLAAPSFVPASWERPAHSIGAIAGATATLLEAVRDGSPHTRLFYAASGAMFGDTDECPQREQTPFRPSTPYAVAKLAAHQLVGAVRVHDGLYACSGIVYNHESERRPPQFVTRRITRGVAEIALGMRSELTVGDLSAVRDWSFAGDIVLGAWMMLQQDEPQDFILAGGVGRTVAELARAAFACVNLEADRHLRVDPALVRAPEGTPSIGDPSRARTLLGWEPHVGFQELVARMVQADLEALQVRHN
ncbi:MAG TPA: GDP-mannose 4,6-dehydratase [Solirubrobacteraceae bacterium]|jgi:GDPmannose 4,6-dehydratase